ISEYIGENKLEVLGQPLPLESDADAQYNWDFNDTFSFTYEIGIAPAFETPFSAETPFTVYDIKADDETLAERVKNLRRRHGKRTIPVVIEVGDVLYATVKQSKEEGNEITASVRTDSIEDAKNKKSLIGLNAGGVAKIDAKKALKVAD